MLRVLVLSKDPKMCRACCEFMRREEVHEVVDAEEALQCLRLWPMDVLILDGEVSWPGGADFVGRLRKERPEVEVVVAADDGLAAARQWGADDCWEAPFDADALALVTARVRRLRELRLDNRRLREEVEGRYSVRHMVGAASAMGCCREMIGRACRSHGGVLLWGEKGTGKELIARAIHYEGPRSRGPFVSFDATTASAAELEGAAASAAGGTLFVRGVENLPGELQEALARIVSGPRKSVRVVASARSPLEECAVRGEFRRDLCRFLGTFSVRVPPLRECKDDIPLLVERFLERRKGDRRMGGIRPEALHLLQRYDWPGNVRELEDEVARACARACSGWIERDDLSGFLDRAISADAVSLESMELETIGRVLEECFGDTAVASRKLGIDRSTLYRKIKRHGLKTQRVRSGRQEGARHE